MKTRILLLVMIFSLKGFSQDSLAVPELRSQVFSLSPISKKVDEVNGLVFGVGHVENRKVTSQTINGANIEANPAPIAGAFVAFLAILNLPEIFKNNKYQDSIDENSEEYLKIKNWDYTPHLKINGLNLSTGCFFTTTSMNGLNISVANKFKDFNGVSITPLGTISDRHNGVAIGIYNANNNLAGLSIGIFNQSQNVKGLHLGILNRAKNNHGLQIGVFNKSNSKGLQIGVWNVNGKRSLPFLNW